MSIEGALRSLRGDPRYLRNVAAWQAVPAEEPHYAGFPEALDPRVAALLHGRGIERLYTHQAAAIEAALSGQHVVVVTPAASGKTLCYNVPVLQRLFADSNARALYLFPTKALAQDQLAGLRELLGKADLPCGAYDGDTPAGQRPKVRDSARIVLTNPDMLHAGILPQHTRWASFFASLRVVVVDEMHVYRGVFGSHVANVLRRLRRVCRFYGGEPQFILASATIANPDQLATHLVEAPVTVVGPELNGAPRGEKHILLYNPPVVDPALGIRRSTNQEAADLAGVFLDAGVQTIVFAGTRLSTELILMDLRAAERIIGGGDAPLPRAGRQAARSVSEPGPVAGYRGGYLPNERRAIERGLRDGSLRGVVATTALELGIDIGQLGAAVLAGYPGTIASTWQQMGRAGRRQEAAAAILVAGPAPLDQYILSHPGYLLGRSPEHALVNPDNPVILANHLACAAAELPFGAHEGFGTLPDVGDVLAYLAEAGDLYAAGERYFWAGDGYPAAGVSLRSSSAERVMIQGTDAAGKPYLVGELDRFSVPLLLYEGAIYIHGGETYRVERLDWDQGIAFVSRVDVDFYTRASLGEGVEVLVERAATGNVEAAAGEAVDAPPVELIVSGGPVLDSRLRVAWGDVRVVSKASGYRILRRTSHEVLGYGTIELPEQVMETTACWLALPPELVESLRAEGAWLSDVNDYGPMWHQQRLAALARDGYRCQHCGAPAPPGRQHDVHHKVPFRAFVADASLRPRIPPEEAWRAANVLSNLVTLCSACHRRAEAGVRTRSGLGGVAALLAGVAPLHLMCDPRDLGLVVEPQPAGSQWPTITIYEQIPAGIGYAQELFELMPTLLGAARELVTACPCERGCPGCVGPILDHDYALDTKDLTLALLNVLLRPTPPPEPVAH